LRARIWVLQIAWNLVFFLTSVFLGYAEKAEKGSSTTYTLTRGKMENIGQDEKIANGKYAIWKFNPDVWVFNFYRGGKELPIDSKEATPFQKAYYDYSYGGGLDPKGLPVVVFPDGSKTSHESVGMKIYEFDAFDEGEARAYIDHINATADATNPVQAIFASIIGAFLFPFLYTFAECLVVASILICVTNPLLGAAIFGPTLFRLWKVGAFKV
jgi:hypothetical protein